ncbi:MAG TPA: hypothetical protein VEK38_00940 [Candidatus Bathyarchaeia archaeon]|nr:hypothetical protein [Candidatus Bathyarchaeia archaeon]
MKIKIILFLLFTALTTTPAENKQNLEMVSNEISTFFLIIHTDGTEKAQELLKQHPKISHIIYRNNNDTIFKTLVRIFLPVEEENEKEKAIIKTICSHPTTTPEHIYDAFVHAISENTQRSLSGALHLLKNYNFPLYLPNKKPTPFAVLLSRLNISMPTLLELHKDLFSTMLLHASKKLDAYFYTFTRHSHAYKNIDNSCPYNYITQKHAYALENKSTSFPTSNPDNFNFFINELKKYNVIPSPKMWNSMKQLLNNGIEKYEDV